MKRAYIYRELQAKPGIASGLNILGIIAQEQGDFLGAAKMHIESLAIRQELGDKKGIAANLADLGGVAINTAKSQLAALLLGAAQRILVRMGAILDYDDRKCCERNAAQTRLQLGQEEFRLTFQKGFQMRWEEIMDLATFEIKSK